MNLSEILEKLQSKNIFLYITLFISIISPVFLIIFIYERELFLKTDIIKLIFLSLSITLPIYLLNTFYFSSVFKYDGYEKRIDDDISKLKTSCQNQILEISSVITDEETLQKEKERLIDYVRGVQATAVSEMEETKQLFFSNNLSGGGLGNIIVFYGAILISYNESFILFINNFLKLEFLFLLSLPIIYISIKKIDKPVYRVLLIIATFVFYIIVSPYISEFVISKFITS